MQVFSLGEKIHELKQYELMITVSHRYEKEIVEQLREFGIQKYLSINEHIYTNFTDYSNAKEKYASFILDDGKSFWNNKESWTTESEFPIQYENERRLIFDEFLPRLKEKPVVADIGCASGAWTNEIAPFCKSVDGFDYSETMIENAKRKYNATNIRFQQCDLKEYQFDKMYDGIMLLGILMYLLDVEGVYNALLKIKRILKPDGILITKETLNITENEALYLYTPINGYFAWYMTQNQYYAQFIKAGFQLISDPLLDVRPIEKDRYGFISRGTVWKLR